MRYAALATLFLLLAFSVAPSGGSAPTPCAPAWTTVVGPNPTTGTNRLAAVSSLSPTRAWAVGYSVDESGNELPLVARWDGNVWTGGNIAAAAAGKSRLTGVVAIAANDVVAVGFTVQGDGAVVPLVERWNGLTWTASNPDGGTGDHRLLAVDATASGDVTAVGYTTNGIAETTLILRWNGAGWTASHPNGGTGGDRLQGVTAISASDVVAVGRTDTPIDLRPLVLRWNGSTWNPSNPDAGTGDHELRAVTAAGGGDVTAVGVSKTAAGSAPLVMRWNGTSWAAAHPLSAGELNGVAAIAGDDVWAVGKVAGAPDATLALHWDGSAWSPAPTPNGTGASELGGVAAAAALDLWAVGGDATATLVERYGACAPSATTEAATDTTQTTATLHGSVMPNGVATDVHFEYGTTTAYGSTTPTTPIGAGTAAVPVSANLTGLSPGATYHARVVATSGAGTTNGEDVTFTTSSAPTVSLAPAATTVVEGDSGLRTVTLAATLSAASSQTATVRWATANGTAGAGADYTAGSGTLTFAPGDVSETISVSVVGEDLDESDETFTVSLSTPVNTSIAGATSTVTISDDDTRPDVTTDPATSVTQTGATLAGRVDPNGKATTYHFEYGTTTAYGQSTPNTSAGSGTAAVSVSAAVTGLTPGATYHARVVATSGAGTTNGGDVTFTTSSAPTVSLAPVATTVVEGDSGFRNVTLTATLSAASSQTATVRWATANGTAGAGTDYTAGSGTLTFAPGDVSETITVRVIGDDLDENDEAFTVSLSTPVNVSLGAVTSTVTIADDDTAPAVTTDPASSVTQTGATLAGTVDPNGKATTYHFEYGTTTAYGQSTPDTSAGSGTTPVSVSAAVTGLSAGATYHFRLVASSAAGSAAGADRTFATGQAALSIADATVTETDAAGTMTFNVTLSSATAETVTVAYATAEGTATDPEDYASRSGTLSFAPGATSRTIAVPIVGDTLDESDETFTVSLSSPTRAVIADGQATGTIVDNDPAPGMRADDASITEGNAGTAQASVTVRLLVPSGRTVTVAYATTDGTATAGSDYAAASGTLTFSPGQTAKTVAVTVNGDAVDEDDETFALHLSSPVNATIADADGTVTIVDDDPQAKLSVNDPAVTEGTGGTAAVAFTVTLAPASGRTVTVDFATQNGTAVAPGDFTAQSGKLTFAKGETTKQVSVPVVTDALDEDDETLSLTLTNAVKADLLDASGTATIRDDDARPGLSIADQSVAEGDSGTTTVTFTVSLCAPGTGGASACSPVASGLPVSAAYATADGTATAGQDYTAASGTLTIQPGATTGTIFVTVTGDPNFEPHETFTVALTNLAGADPVKTTATAEIRNDDVRPEIVIRDASTVEGGNLTFTIALCAPGTGGNGQPACVARTTGVSIAVNFTTLPGTACGASPSALEAVDYQSVGGQRSFQSGDSTRTFSVQTNGDKVKEPDKKLCARIQLEEGSQGVVSRATAIGTIVDDDTAPVASIDDVRVTEGDGGSPVATFTVTFSNPSEACTADGLLCGASVRWAAVAGSATAPGDFTAASGTVVMAPPDTSFQYRLAYPVSVPLVGDALDEPDEQFAVVLSDAKLSTIGRGIGAATIVDDDAPPAAATGDPAGLRPDGATLAGVANPGTKATSAWFEYGPTTAYGSSTPATALPGDGTGRTVTAALSGLSFGTAYHFRLVAANPTGTAYGADRAFTTPYPPAEAATGDATGVTPTAATLAGTARTYGLEGSAWFEYGPTTAYGSATQARPVAAGTLENAVSETLTGLAESSTYHFRLVVRRGDEVATGADGTFTTGRRVQTPPPPKQPEPKPTPKPKPKFSALTSGAVSGSDVTFAVRCIKAQPSCRGTIVLDAATRALSGATRPSITRIGQAVFTRRPGGVVQVRVHIGPRAVEAVRKTRRLAVVATITVRDAKAMATRTMRLRLTMPRRA